MSYRVCNKWNLVCFSRDAWMVVIIAVTTRWMKPNRISLRFTCDYLSVYNTHFISQLYRQLEFDASRNWSKWRHFHQSVTHAKFIIFTLFSMSLINYLDYFDNQAVSANRHVIETFRYQIYIKASQSYMPHISVVDLVSISLLMQKAFKLKRW